MSDGLEEQFDLVPAVGSRDPSKEASPYLKSKEDPEVLDHHAAAFETPMMTRQMSESSNISHHFEPRLGDQKLVLVMVGLPARGKSYITRHLKRYLTFEGFGARVFNAGDYRRKLLGPGQDAAFFDPQNEKGRKLRRQCADASLEDLLLWLQTTEKAHVGILDATNSTAERRAALMNRCSESPGIRVAFLESICTNQEVLEKNYRMKMRNADYTDWDPEAALKDFSLRLAQYEKLYETIEETEGNGDTSFMKILNCGEKMVQWKCEGYLVSKVAGYMLNLHTEPRIVYLTRHGLCGDNVAEKLGGDSRLTQDGIDFARRLRDFMRMQLGWSTDSPDTQLASDAGGDRRGWLLVTSQLQRSRQTARPLLEDSSFVAKSGMTRVHTVLLNEIRAGIYEGYTAKSFALKAPEEHKARMKDKLRYRYPRGESYLDLVQRVRPVLMEIEGEKRPALVIAHQAVLRTIIAFFQGTPLEEMTRLPIPLHTVIKLSISPHGCEVESIPLMHGSSLPSASSNDSIHQEGLDSINDISPAASPIKLLASPLQTSFDRAITVG